MEELAKQFDEMPAFHKARAMNAYKEHGEKQKQLSPITEYFRDKSYYQLLDIANVFDDYQIAKVESTLNKTKEIVYHVFVNYQPIARTAYTLDNALLVAIAHKYGLEDAAVHISRMLGIKNEPQIVE